MKKAKTTHEDKAEARKDKKLWTAFIKAMVKKGALITNN